MLLTSSMREIFKYKKGKDFYRDSLEYFEYDIEMLYDREESLIHYMDDEEIAYYVSKKIGT